MCARECAHVQGGAGGQLWGEGHKDQGLVGQLTIDQFSVSVCAGFSTPAVPLPLPPWMDHQPGAHINAAAHASIPSPSPHHTTLIIRTRPPPLSLLTLLSLPPSHSPQALFMTQLVNAGCSTTIANMYLPRLQVGAVGRWAGGRSLPGGQLVCGWVGPSSEASPTFLLGCQSVMRLLGLDS